MTPGPPGALRAARALGKWRTKPRVLAVIPFSSSSLGFCKVSAVSWRFGDSSAGQAGECWTGFHQRWRVGETSPDGSLLSFPKTVLMAATWELQPFLGAPFVESTTPHHAEVPQQPPPQAHQSSFCFVSWSFEMERGGASSQQRRWLEGRGMTHGLKCWITRFLSSPSQCS